MELVKVRTIHPDQPHLSWDVLDRLDLKERNMNQPGHCLQRFVEILQLSKRLQEFLQFHDQDLDGPKIEKNK